MADINGSYLPSLNPFKPNITTSAIVDAPAIPINIIV